jgi:hypothetical protein
MIHIATAKALVTARLTGLGPVSDGVTVCAAVK